MGGDNPFAVTSGRIETAAGVPAFRKPTRLAQPSDAWSLEAVADELARAHLHVVTGKGGAGKTTAAAALAVALATEGGRTLLVEVEGHQARASRICSIPPRCPTRSGVRGRPRRR